MRNNFILHTNMDYYLEADMDYYIEAGITSLHRSFKFKFLTLLNF